MVYHIVLGSAEELTINNETTRVLTLAELCYLLTDESSYIRDFLYSIFSLQAHGSTWKEVLTVIKVILLIIFKITHHYIM